MRILLHAIRLPRRRQEWRILKKFHMKAVLPYETRRLRMRGTHPEALCLLMMQVQQLWSQDQPALYLSSISIQLPTVKAASAQYAGSSSTSLPVVVHHS